jgi:hypothetical protein
MRDLTQILQAVERGENSAERLLPLVYDELRRLAAQQMAKEDPESNAKSPTRRDAKESEW